MTRARVASWGRWTCHAVRVIRIGGTYWVRAPGGYGCCCETLMMALLAGDDLAERMAERYG